MDRNTNICSRIPNGENRMELIVYYNNMAVGLVILNAEKDVNAKESVDKKVEEAAEMAKNKASKNSEETNKHNEMIPRFQS